MARRWISQCYETTKTAFFILWKFTVKIGSIKDQSNLINLRQNSNECQSINENKLHLKDKILIVRAVNSYTSKNTIILYTVSLYISFQNV